MRLPDSQTLSFLDSQILRLSDSQTPRLPGSQTRRLFDRQTLRLSRISSSWEYHMFESRTQSVFYFCLSTVRAKLGSLQLSEAYCPPNAVQNSMFEIRTTSVFYFCLSTVRAKPGSLQLSEAYCPPNAVQNSISKVAQTRFFIYVCRLSVPSHGRRFYHFERQSSQCASKLSF